METRIRHRLDEATQEHPILEHPFYKAWAAGTLTREDLAFYSTQYWRQVEAFPGYLETAAGRIDDNTARRIVEANLSDEVDDDHPGLWLRFASALGVDEDTVRSSEATPETQGCVARFQEGTRSSSLPFALGMLYGYESQTPGVAATKIEGLKRHYGVEGPGTQYFALHGELDVEHASEMAEAIALVCSNEADASAARRGAVAGAAAVWGLLDGVARVREISC